MHFSKNTTLVPLEEDRECRPKVPPKPVASIVVRAIPCRSTIHGNIYQLRNHLG